MVFAVDTESGIQDIRNLLVFFVARGPSFATEIVVPAGGGRNEGAAPTRQGADCRRALRARI